MKAIGIIILSLLIPACTVKTEIIRKDSGYIVKSKRNAMVVVKNRKTGEQFMIDNRGKPSYLELILATIIGDTKKSAHVELENLDDKEVD